MPVGLRDDIGRLVRMLVHELHGSPPCADDGADLVALRLGRRTVDDAQHVAQGRQHLLRRRDRPQLRARADPDEVRHGGDVDQPKVERRDALAEAAGLDRLDVAMLRCGGR